MDYEKILAVAKTIAQEAGDVVARAFPRGSFGEVRFKGSVNPAAEVMLPRY
jgi:hypothetical protein